jgi:hypothetical protein
MINGIPLKIKVIKEDGSCSDYETIYLSTFRKCPKLKDMSKEFFAILGKGEKLEKLNSLYDSKLKQLDFVELETDNAEKQIEELTSKIEQIRNEIMTISIELEEFQKNYIKTSLIGAGYTEEQSEKYAEKIPLERFSEIMDATRTGAMTVLDFFMERSLAAQN